MQKPTLIYRLPILLYMVSLVYELHIDRESFEKLKTELRIFKRNYGSLLKLKNLILLLLRIS
ncbi:hypothetical protein AAHE18_11G103600 [Arachis hypogaea]